MLNIDDYPQLRMLAWNRPGNRTITEAGALELYETNRRFVEPDTMNDQEHDLLTKLVHEYGHGVFHV